MLNSKSNPCGTTVLVGMVTKLSVPIKYQNPGQMIQVDISEHPMGISWSIPYHCKRKAYFLPFSGPYQTFGILGQHQIFLRAMRRPPSCDELYSNQIGSLLGSQGTCTQMRL